MAFARPAERPMASHPLQATLRLPSVPRVLLLRASLQSLRLGPLLCLTPRRRSGSSSLESPARRSKSYVPRVAGKGDFFGPPPLALFHCSPPFVVAFTDTLPWSLQLFNPGGALSKRVLRDHGCSTVKLFMPKC